MEKTQQELSGQLVPAAGRVGDVEKVEKLLAGGAEEEKDDE